MDDKDVALMHNITRIIKKRFPNVTTEETVILVSEILREVTRVYSALGTESKT